MDIAPLAVIEGCQPPVDGGGAFAEPSPPSGWPGEFHFQTVEHARPTKMPDPSQGVGVVFPFDSTRCECPRHRVEQIGLIGDSDDVCGLGPLGRDSNLRTGMVLRGAIRLRCIVHPHIRAISRGEDTERAGVCCALISTNSFDNLARVSVVCRDDNQRVRMLFGILKADRNGFVERDGFSDLLARVFCVVLLVDRCSFYLQDEARRTFACPLPFSPSAASSSSSAFAVISESAGSFAGR